MNDDELRRAYAALRRQRAAQRHAPDAPPGPHPDALWSAVAGDLEPGERVRILDEALRSGAGDDLALVHSLHTAARAASPTAASTTVRRRGVGRWWPVAAAAALAASVSVPLLRSEARVGEAAADAARAITTDTTTSARFRGATASGPALVAPAPSAPPHDTTAFVWHTVAHAMRYELELLDDAGRTVARVTTTDTTARLPVDLTVSERARVNGWWVTVTLPDGRTGRSELRLLSPPAGP